MGTSSHGRQGTKLLLSLLLVSNVLIVYSNHFGNDFHFDDTQSIRDNPAIRNLSGVRRAFVDPSAFSVAPAQRNYRPVTTASLAIDYRLGQGLNPVFFHISTFFWFGVQLVLMFLLFERMMDWADPHPSNQWTALAAAICFGLHPANAETVNYIIQRADLYNALGCVASLWLFVRYPQQRKFGWYLAPAILGILAKAPGLVFPLLLLAYVWLFEQGDAPPGKRWQAAFRTVLPALLVTLATGYLLLRMQPATWNSGAVSASQYRIIQPFVALYFFKSFFLPTGLSVDPGWHFVTPFSLQAIAGSAFVAVMLGIALLAARSRRGKPLAFGIFWFFAALLPTSLTPLGDVMNDHRMFFAFVGLVLSVVWSLRLALFYRTARLTAHRAWVNGAVGALAVVLMVSAAATRQRNRVWSTEQSLWRDAVAKNPANARAWSNLGAVYYEQADYPAALSCFERANALQPDGGNYESNLIRAATNVGERPEAESHLRHLVASQPSNQESYLLYARWLTSQQRYQEADNLLERAQHILPASPELRRARWITQLQRDADDRVLLTKTLDSDHDTVISSAELVAAPMTLRGLDRNGDGKLSAEECGAHFGAEILNDPALRRRKEREFMRSHRILNVLDANHDGEISAVEIRDAERQLRRLDTDHDGALRRPETAGDVVLRMVNRIAQVLDPSRRGHIDAQPPVGTRASGFLDLLSAADLDGDHSVSLEELTDEVFYRADLNKDGAVTKAEIEAAEESGAFGPVTHDVPVIFPARYRALELHPGVRLLGASNRFAAVR